MLLSSRMQCGKACVPSFNRSALQRSMGSAKRMPRLAASRADSESHLQLATAKLPTTTDAGRFADAMYQWAATLTQSGANLPFALPLKADKLPTGFQISLLKRSAAGGFDSAGDVVGTVESVSNVGEVFMVRFFEGPAAHQDRRTPTSTDATERLEVVLQSLVDVDVIMSTMAPAIRNAVASARSA